MIQPITFVLAQFLGWAASRIRIPGAGIVVPMFGSAAIAVWLGAAPTPFWVRFTILTLMGTAIGAQVDRASLLGLRRILPGATLAAVGIIVLGVLTTLLLRRIGLAPHGDMLATSPGALSAMTAAALENDFDAPTVAVFHITRILIIVLSIPLLVRSMTRGRSTGTAAVLSNATGAGEDDRDAARPTAPTEPVGHTAIHFTEGEPFWSRTQRLLRFLLPTAGATIAAAVGLRLTVPFPIVVNAFLGAALVTLVLPATAGLPKAAGLFVQSGLAWLIGSMVTRDTLTTLGPVVTGAVLSSLVLVAGGLFIALGLRRLGWHTDGDVLATSPGALEVLTMVGAEHGASAVDIGLFHLLRLLLVMLTLPVMLLWTL